MSTYGSFAERFFQCAICLDVLKHPKTLPCLHRYCKECLQEWIQKGRTTVACPQCKKKFPIPKDGVDGFQTDFHIQSQIEYIQQQKTHLHLKGCNCLDFKEPTGFCFKCNDFLCKDCLSEHTTSSAQDHQSLVVTLKEIETNLNLTVDKLVILTEAPVGEVPSEEITLADEQRKELNKRVVVLKKLKHKVIKLPTVIYGLKTELTADLYEKTKGRKAKYEDTLEVLDAKINGWHEKEEASKTQMEEEKEQYFEWIQKEMNTEIEQVREKYGKMFESKERELKSRMEPIQQGYIKKRTKLNREKELLESDFERWSKSTQSEHREYLNKIQEIWMHFENAIKRFEELTAISSCLLLSKNHLVASKCIPDLLTVFEPLIKDIELAFPELHTLLQDKIKNVPFSSLVAGKRSIITIIGPEGTKVHIEGSEGKDWCVDSITSDGDGNIVITGLHCKGHSHVTSINVNGKILKNFKIQSSLPLPKRYCAFLSNFKIATVCWPNKIAVFDVRDSSHTTKNISDAVTQFHNRDQPFALDGPLLVSCVATDASAGHIFVGEKGRRRVFVLDNMLNYRNTFYLPKMLQSARDMAVSEDRLLICDEKVKRAIAMRITKDEGDFLYEFNKPVEDGCKWTPFSICTDKEGFTYILWRTQQYDYQGKCMFTQYGPDDPHILTTRMVDGDSQCIATIETKEGKRILVATSKNLYSFCLIHIDGSNSATSDA